MRRDVSGRKLRSMDPSEVETARRRLEEARRVLDHGRDGASAAWLEAVADYVSKCQEEYLRVLERAHADLTQKSSPNGWPSHADGHTADQEGGRRPN